MRVDWFSPVLSSRCREKGRRDAKTERVFPSEPSSVFHEVFVSFENSTRRWADFGPGDRASTSSRTWGMANTAVFEEANEHRGLYSESEKSHTSESALLLSGTETFAVLGSKRFCFPA